MLRKALTAATLIGVGWLTYRLETLMVDFTAFDEAVTRHNDALTGAVSRVQEDVSALQATVEELRSQIDPKVQAKLDERTAALNESTTALNAIDPVPAAPVDGDQPTA